MLEPCWLLFTLAMPTFRQRCTGLHHVTIHSTQHNSVIHCHAIKQLSMESTLLCWYNWHQIWCYYSKERVKLVLVYSRSTVEVLICSSTCSPPARLILMVSSWWHSHRSSLLLSSCQHHSNYWSTWQDYLRTSPRVSGVTVDRTKNRNIDPPLIIILIQTS